MLLNTRNVKYTGWREINMKQLVGCKYIAAVISDFPTSLYRRYFYSKTQAKYIN